MPIFFFLTLFFSPFLFAKAPESISRQLAPPTKTIPYTYTFDAAFTFFAPYLETSPVAYFNGDSNTVGNTLRPKQKAAPGFYLAIGATTFEENRCALLKYLWFDSPAILVDNPLAEGQNYQNPYDSSLLNELSSKLLFQFNRMDAIFQITSKIHHRFIANFFGGLSGAWDFTNLTFISSPVGTTGEPNVFNQFTQNWWGIGPYGGGIMNFYFFKNVSLYQSLGGALYITNHRIREWQSNDEEESNFKNKVTHRNNVEAMLETSLGVKGRFILSDWIITPYIAWELQTYFDHLSFSKEYAPLGLFGNYSMQGLALGITLDF